MLSFFRNFFTKKIGIDLGTANTLVYVTGKGIVIRETSVVAINRDTGAVLSVGNEAKRMIGRTPGNIVAIRPMKDGVIADFEVTNIMLNYFIKKTKTSSFFKPQVVIAVPSGVTTVEERAVKDAAREAGAANPITIEEPMAAAMGAGLPVKDPVGNMVVDIGGGTTEVAVISLGGIVVCKSVRIAGDEMDEAIIQYIKRKYKIEIGERMAETIKIEIGSALPLEEEKTYELRGRDLMTGLPKTAVIKSEEIREALMDPIYSIIDAIKATLEKTPPELAADIMDRGIMMTGGGAYIRGLNDLISQEVGMPVLVSDHALECVALGTGIFAEYLSKNGKI